MPTSPNNFNYGGFNFVSTFEHNIPNTNLAIIKVDSNGEVEWSKEYDFGGHDLGSVIRTDSMGNIYVLSSSQFEEKSFDGNLIKLNSSGELLWNINFGGTNYDYVYDFKFDEFENIYIVGTTSDENEIMNGMIWAFNNDGESLLELETNYSEEENDWLKAIYIYKDEMYVLGSKFDQGESNVILDKYTLLGEHIGFNPEVLQSPEILVFPNPASGDFYVQLDGKCDNSLIEIFDLGGKKVREISTSNNVIKHSIGALSNGSYLIKWTGCDIEKTKTLIISKD